MERDELLESFHVQSLRFWRVLFFVFRPCFAVASFQMRQLLQVLLMTGVAVDVGIRGMLAEEKRMIHNDCERDLHR